MRPSTIALVTAVVPCATAASRRSPASPSWLTPARTPIDGFSGVVGTLSSENRPAASRAIRSVNVPPTSTPTRAPAALRPALLRNDVRVEPFLPGGQRLRARLVVHDVAALLPLRRRREHAGLPAQARRHGRLEVGRSRLERLHELLLDLFRQREIDELMRGVRLLRA